MTMNNVTSYDTRLRTERLGDSTSSIPANFYCLVAQWIRQHPPKVWTARSSRVEATIFVGIVAQLAEASHF